MKNTNEKTISGLERIEEIKSEISACSKCPKFRKAEVYEMWQDVDQEESG